MRGRYNLFAAGEGATHAVPRACVAARASQPRGSREPGVALTADIVIRAPPSVRASATFASPRLATRPPSVFRASAPPNRRPPESVPLRRASLPRGCERLASRASIRPVDGRGAGAQGDSAGFRRLGERRGRGSRARKHVQLVRWDSEPDGGADACFLRAKRTRRAGGWNPACTGARTQARNGAGYAIVPCGVSASGSSVSAINASSGTSKLARMPNAEARTKPNRG
jgi:hypothetical protein